MLTLEVQKRTEVGKGLKKLRAEGKMPAVFYGKKEESTPITLSQNDFNKVWKEAGESTVITLKGIGSEKEVLIHDVDIDPIFSTPRHVDFYVIEKGKKVTVDVPLEFEGVAPAVKELGGTLIKVLHAIEIEAMPKDLPHEIEVDVSGLDDFEKQILVKDVALPAGVEALTDGNEVVALVQPEKEEEEVTETPDLSSIEVEQKGKEESEEADSPGEGQKE